MTPAERIAAIRARLAAAALANSTRCSRCGYMPPGANWCDDCSLVETDADLEWLLERLEAATKRGDENWKAALDEQEYRLSVQVNADELRTELAAARARIAELEAELVWVQTVVGKGAVQAVEERIAREVAAEHNAARSHVERLEGEAASLKTVLECTERNLELTRVQRDRLEGEAAAMRAALEELRLRTTDNWAYSVVVDALAPDAGCGWVSPEEHARVQGEAGAMREALASARHLLCCYTSEAFGVDHLRPRAELALVAANAALAPNAGCGYVPYVDHARVQGEAGALRGMLERLAVQPSSDLIGWMECSLCGDEWESGEKPRHEHDCALAPNAGRRLVAIARAAEALVKAMESKEDLRLLPREVQAALVALRAALEGK